MKKYTSQAFGYELKVVVADDGTVYQKAEKRNVPRLSNCNGVTGGKWETKPARFFARKSVEAWLADIEAAPANFKGAPKGVR